MRVAAPDSNSPIPDLSSYAPEIVGASNAYVEAMYRHSKLPIRVFEAGRYATALINGCVLCRNWRTARDIPHLGIHEGNLLEQEAPDEALYEAIENDDLDKLTPRERITVRYVRMMGTDPQALAQNENFWSEMKSLLTDQEIVDLSYSCACWMGLGRVAHVLGVDVACSIPTHQKAEAAAA